MKKRMLKLWSVMTCACICLTMLLFFPALKPLRAFAYNPGAAIEYAQKYAYDYNSDYKNYNSSGGDCANFVSQCLYAGGLAMTDGWHYRNSGSDVTGSWTGCTSMHRYFESAGYTIIENPSSAQLIPGNVVLYAKDNSGTWNHAAILVENNGSDTPKVAAHNNNHDSIDWRLGDSWSKRCTILVSDTPEPRSADTPISDYPRPIGNVRLNDRGDDVRWVQQTLNKLGASLAVDGIFGTGTKKAVEDFQKQYNLNYVDGEVGPETKGKIVALLSGSSVPVPGTSGDSAAENAETIFRFLTGDLKLSAAAACGVLGNIQKETGGTYGPDAFNPNDTGGTQSYGICQWNSGGKNRYAQLKAFTDAYNTLDGQLAFMKHELESDKYFKYTEMKAFGNTEDDAANAAKLWAIYYEGCDPKSYAERQENARIHYRTRTGSSGQGSDPGTGAAQTAWQSVNKTYIVSTQSDNLNMRSAPSASGSVIASIPRGTEVFVVRTADNWGEVQWNGKTGYCSMDYLTEKAEVPAPQQTAVTIPYP
ncbi:MAG: amidase domain-containing protein, partial [Oscillospiraceae bacterium]|nr:amidase domain-containing protein [Oscillospiraceae bacterium]